MDRSTPAYPPRSICVTVFMPGQEGGRTLGSNKLSYMDDMINGSIGVGTQLDTFAHLGGDYTFYNGLKAQDIVQHHGVTKLGVEGVPPMVTRGVLVDLAKARASRGSTAASWSRRTSCARHAAAERARHAGDVVVLHTAGCPCRPGPEALRRREPGIDGAGAEMLAGTAAVRSRRRRLGRGMRAVQGPERALAGTPGAAGQNGIHILENLDASALVRDGVTEFMFVLGQPRYRGAVQAIINPVAIR